MKKIASFLEPRLAQQARLLGEMTVSARSRLSSDLASHCWVGGYDQQYLTLVTDHPCFATHLRFHQHEIVKQINEEFGDRLPQRLRKALVRVSREPMTP